MSLALLKSITEVSQSLVLKQSQHLDLGGSRAIRDPAPLLRSITEVRAALSKARAPAQAFGSFTTSSPHLITSLRTVSLAVCAREHAPDVAESAVPSVLKAIGRPWHENTHSDYIAALLDPEMAGTFAFRLHAALIGDPSAHFDYQLSHREVRLGSLLPHHPRYSDSDRRIDILVRTPTHVLVIENKVQAAESDGQTGTYLDAVTEAFKSGAREPRIHGLLLSPDGRAAQSSGFRSITYVQLFDVLRKLVDEVVGHPLLAVYRFYLNELYQLFVRPKLSSVRRTQEFWRTRADGS